MPAATPHFRLLGFPVRIGAGFVVFMALLAFIPRAGNAAFGFWLAGAVAVFTLLHELGHAVVARHAGADAGISLEFMAGYTSFRPTRPISRPMSIAISLAGPLTHIACGVVVLVVLGYNPLDLDAIRSSDAALAIWFAGPVIGALNLIPVLPLDGGNVVTTLLDAAAPGRSDRIMTYVSTAITVAALVSAAFVDITRQFVIFIAFLLLFQLSRLSALRAATATPALDAVTAAEQRGDGAAADRLFLRALTREGAGGGRSPTSLDAAAGREALLAVAQRHGLPLPHGNELNAHYLALTLIMQGQARLAADYAAAGYAANPGAMPALAVARAAAVLGDAATAAGWLRTASSHAVPAELIRQMISGAGEFAAIRSAPEITELLASLPRTSPPS